MFIYLALSYRHNKPERFSSIHSHQPPFSFTHTHSTLITREPRDHQLLALLTHSSLPAQTFHPSLIPLVWVTTSLGSDRLHWTLQPRPGMDSDLTVFWVPPVWILFITFHSPHPFQVWNGRLFLLTDLHTYKSCHYIQIRNLSHDSFFFFFFAL